MEPITPDEAVELYLKDKSRESADSTVRSHRSRLSHFLDWCKAEGITDMNDLTARRMHEHRVWRRGAGDRDANPVTMRSHQDTVRVFLRWCLSIDAIPEGLPEKVLSPELDPDQNVRTDMLDPEVGEELVDHLEKYEYATRGHVVMLLIWRGFLRRGAVRALDLDDLTLDGDPPHTKIRHRPEAGTPLKNAADADRKISFRESTAGAIGDYIERNRIGIKDDENRSPLVTTEYGRPHRQTIQVDSYAVTRPCVSTGECPHDKDPSECTAARNRSKAFQCPSSKSPHAIRRGAITRALSDDVPETVVGDRASTSPEVLDQHYDERGETRRMEQRRDYFTDI